MVLNEISIKKQAILLMSDVTQQQSQMKVQDVVISTSEQKTGTFEHKSFSFVSCCIWLSQKKKKKAKERGHDTYQM